MDQASEQYDAAQASLMLYLAGELPEEQRAEFEQRLEHDPALRASLDELGHVQQEAFAALGALDAAEGAAPATGGEWINRRLGSAVRQYHVERLARRGPEIAAVRPAGRMLTRVAAVAACVLVAAGIFWQLRPEPRPEIAGVPDQPIAASPDEPSMIGGIVVADVGLMMDDSNLREAEQELSAVTHLRMLTE